MKALVLTLLMILVGASGPVWAADSSATKKQNTGDIDMNQFKNLESPSNPEKVKDNRIKVQMTCTDPQGNIIKKGEKGFDTCLGHTQSPVINQPRTPEPPNDPRSF